MERRRLITIIAGVALVALGAFLTASLVTHDPGQGPFADFPPPATGGNACGVAGVYVSAYALALFGWPAYVPALLLIAAGAVLVSGRRPHDALTRSMGALLLMGAFMLALALVNASPSATSMTYRASPGTAGGMLGILLAGALYRGVGSTGALIVLAVSLCVGVLLAAGAEAAWAFNRWGRLGWVALCSLWRTARPVAPSPTSERAVPEREVPEPVEAPRSVRAASPEEPGADGEEEVPAPEPEPEMAPVEEQTLITTILPGGDEQESADFDLPEEHLAKGDYQLPALSLLDEPDAAMSGEDEALIREKSHVLERTLSEFKVDAKVVRIQRGPVITMYELSLAPGTKVSKVESLADDLAIALKAPNVRIVAPLPGRNTVGIEVPNTEREIVGIRELMEATRGRYEKYEVPLFLGKDTAGAPLVLDLASCPHLMVAGATGSGKSVAISGMICGILMTRTPDEVKLLLIDPKSVEFSQFARLPHLLCPVLTDMKRAASVLKWACKKMDERYSVLSQAGVRNLTAYNKLGREEIIRRLNPEDEADIEDVPFRMPHVVIIVDEFGELMMVAAKEVESSVTRLSQKARAVGIHLICATQRPSVDVITGLIKANLPARIAFQVASKVDSRTILDRNGAELLLGRGDMLLLPPGTSRLVRAQGAYISDRELNGVVAAWEEQGGPSFQAELREVHAQASSSDAGDDLYEDAVRIVLESQRGSVSLLQRRLSVGYSRAARLIDMMAEAGIVGPYRGSQARRVLMTLEEWEKAHAKAS